MIDFILGLTAGIVLGDFIYWKVINEEDDTIFNRIRNRFSVNRDD